MLQRRSRALRGHVARLAVVSLVGFGLVALPGAANAEPRADGTPSAKPSGDHRVCLPRTPVDDVDLPVDLPTCLPDRNPPAPSGGSDPADPAPAHHRGHGDGHGDGHSRPGGSGGLCIPLPRDLLDQLPASIPTCLPKCVTAGVLRTLKNLPRDTLNELLGDIMRTVGELPDCLLSLLPKPSQPSQPPHKPPHHRSPAPEPSPTHSHKPKPKPTHTVHVTYKAGPAKAISGRPDFTG